MEAEDYPGTWSRSITAEILTEDFGLCELFISVSDWGPPTLSFEMKDVQTYAEKDYWPAHNDLSPSVPGTDISKLDVTWEDSNKEDVEVLTELKNTLSKDRYKRNSKENELYNPDKLQSSADPDYLKKQLLKTYDESKADPMPGEYSDLIEVLSGYYPIDPARPGGVMDGFIYLQKAGSPYAFGIMSQKDVAGIYDLKQIPSDFENCSRRFGLPEHLQKGVWRWRIQDTHYSVLNVYNLANPDLTRKPGGKDKTGIITILIREEDEAETSTNVPVSTTAADNAVQTSDSRWQQEPDGRWRFFPWNNEAPDFYAVNGWYQDNDGKHYYFDRDGYMLQDTVTPDGYTVGVDGALIENVPQVTKKVNYPKMTISLAYQEEEYLQEYAAAFAKEVHDRTDGSITIENIGNADGLSEDDMIIDYTRNFACMMLADPGRLRVEYPHVLWDYLRIPFFFNDSAEAEVYLEAVTPQVFSNNFYQEHGVKILAHCLNGLSHFVSTVPLRTPEDLTGLKLRTQGSEIDFEFYSGLGAEPGFLALPDLYSAAENGQFDAADLSLETYSDFQLYKVWPYVSMTGNRMQTFSLICPSFLWEEFNPDVKEVLQSCAVEAARKQLEWKEDRENRLLSKLENEYGVTVVPSMDVQVLQEKSAPYDKF